MDSIRRNLILNTAAEMDSRKEEASSITRLTAGLAAGKEEAFREFHAAYFDRLLRYLLAVAKGDEAQAKEALQETLLRVARHVRRFDEENAFWSWLTVLARSAARDGGRKSQRYRKLLTRFALFRSLPDETEPNADPEARLRQGLEQCLTELKEPDRTLVREKYYQKATVEQLAAKHEMTVKAVESRLLRARGRLRESIQRYLKNERSE